MKKILLPLLGCFISLSSFQCEKEVLDNTRSVITGLLVDDSGRAINGLSIKITSQHNVLGQSATASNGQFKFTSLRSNRGEFNFEFNGTDINPNYGSITYHYTDSAFLEKYGFGEIVLTRSASLNFKLIKTSQGNSALDFELKYLGTACRYFYENNELQNNESCFPEEVIEESLSDADPNFEIDLIAPMNSIVEFNYQIPGEPVQSLQITLNEPVNNYEFEY